MAAAIRREFRRPDFDGFSALTHWQLLLMEALSGAAPAGHPRRGGALLASIAQHGADQAMADDLFGEARDGWPAYVATRKPGGIMAAAHAAEERWAAANHADDARARLLVPTPTPAPRPIRCDAEDLNPTQRAASNDGTVRIRYHWPRILAEPWMVPVVERAIGRFSVDGDRRSLRAAINQAIFPAIEEADRRIDAILTERRGRSGGNTAMIVRDYHQFGLISRNGTELDGAEDVVPDVLPVRYAVDTDDIRRLEAVAPWITVTGGPAA